MRQLRDFPGHCQCTTFQESKANDKERTWKESCRRRSQGSTRVGCVSGQRQEECICDFVLCLRTAQAGVQMPKYGWWEHELWKLHWLLWANDMPSRPRSLMRNCDGDVY